MQAPSSEAVERLSSQVAAQSAPCRSALLAELCSRTPPLDTDIRPRRAGSGSRERRGCFRGLHEKSARALPRAASPEFRLKPFSHFPPFLPRVIIAW
ncbi:hypothetical protein MRX96_016549 [Rhipicephalus microplus]